MRHALMYVGSYEKNFGNLSSDTKTFEGSDGKQYDYGAVPSSADGLRIGYMEKAGKNFVAVRVSDSKNDVALKHEVNLNPGEHFPYGVRLSGEPALVEDDKAILKLLEDIALKNKESGEQLLLIRTRLKAAMAEKK